MGWRELERFAREQGGVFTRAQALDFAGRRELERSLDQGAWYPVFRGVYSTRPPDTGVRAHAARLYFSLHQVVVGYRTAAELHGLHAPPDGKTHVIVPRRVVCTEPGISAHRDSFPCQQNQLWTGLLLTTAARTAVDLARTVGPLDARAVLESAVSLHHRSGGYRGAPLEALWDEVEAGAYRPGIRQVVRELAELDPKQRRRRLWIS